jgi:hypothetical protein
MAPYGSRMGGMGAIQELCAPHGSHVRLFEVDGTIREPHAPLGCHVHCMGAMCTAWEPCAFYESSIGARWQHMGGKWCHTGMGAYGAVCTIFELCAPYGSQMHLKGAMRAYGSHLALYGSHMGKYENHVHLVSHVGGLGCGREAVCALWELCVVIWEVYGIVRKPDAPDWSCVIQLGAMWCCMEAKCYMGAIFPHLGAMCDQTGAACTIWKPYSADGWDPGASSELTRQAYIGFYSGGRRHIGRILGIPWPASVSRNSAIPVLIAASSEVKRRFGLVDEAIWAHYGSLGSVTRRVYREHCSARDGWAGKS